MFESARVTFLKLTFHMVRVVRPSDVRGNDSRCREGGGTQISRKGETVELSSYGHISATSATRQCATRRAEGQQLSGRRQNKVQSHTPTMFDVRHFDDFDKSMAISTLYGVYKLLNSLSRLGEQSWRRSMRSVLSQMKCATKSHVRGKLPARQDRTAE